MKRAICQLHSTRASVLLTPSPRLSAFQQRRRYALVHAADLSFGQPVHETHPHILKSGELTPGITAAEYAQRRASLAHKLPNKAVAIVAAADLLFRSGNVFYEFHQDPDFFYLTGFNEPEALAIIGKDETGKDHTFHLYVREKDEKLEIWDGARSGTEAARDVFNADEVGDIKHVKKVVSEVTAEASQVFTDITTTGTNVTALRRFFYGTPPKTADFANVIDPTKVKSLRAVMNDLRAFKSRAEIENMRLAGKASGRAHTAAMRQGFTMEKQLDAFFRYRCVAEGCDTAAFEPVVAVGKNALSIHYVRNDDLLLDGELVLVDGGGKYGGYIADITRTWPVTGKFSDAQRDLYQAVLSVQREVITMCRESAEMSLDKLHSAAESKLKEQLTQLGFDMSGNAIEALFPHHLSHYIGLDVHDCVGYSRKTLLKEGHCITIEPGVYVPANDRWPKHFQGIGIRIEDSVSVQRDGPYVLTTEAIKEVVDIEALRN